MLHSIIIQPNHLSIVWNHCGCRIPYVSICYSRCDADTFGLERCPNFRRKIVGLISIHDTFMKQVSWLHYTLGAACGLKLVLTHVISQNFYIATYICTCKHTFANHKLWEYNHELLHRKVMSYSFKPLSQLWVVCTFAGASKEPSHSPDQLELSPSYTWVCYNIAKTTIVLATHKPSRYSREQVSKLLLCYFLCQQNHLDKNKLRENKVMMATAKCNPIICIVISKFWSPDEVLNLHGCS